MIPKIDLPTYDLTIPSNGKTITIRPFLVKEEKLLLIALETKEDSDIINTTKQIIRNCIIDGDVDIDKLPFFDVDYLFIALRAKSVGDSIEVKFTCNNYLGDGSVCGEVFPATIDIANCKVIKNESISPDVVINDKFRVKMKYPTYTVMKSIMDNDNILDKKIRIIAGSIDYIQEKDKIYSASKDVTKEELIAFIEGLTQEQFKRLETFVDNFPYFIVTSKQTCPKCGYDHELEYREFTSFFV